MVIKTANINSIKPFVCKLNLPKPNSHKGENGKVLIIGGSSLFHAASIWAAEVASYFVDIVHYSSTVENEKVFLSLKKKFINGIIVPQKDLCDYVKEDDAILIGPGMIRKPKSQITKIEAEKFEEILKIKDEGKYTYYLTKYLIDNFPDKKFVFDAGSLQMMEDDWLTKLRQSPIITPHQVEFEKLFNLSISQKSQEEKVAIVKEVAKKYKTTILLKAVDDIISDGEKLYIIQGGNAGLTKGGTGDILAGLTVSFYGKNSSLESAIIASFLLKKAADVLFKKKGYWYNINDIIQTIPGILKKLINI
ncbi:MAG: NAD(P)H-hydrate dehydratase [Microgenomates group bacterium]